MMRNPCSRNASVLVHDECRPQAEEEEEEERFGICGVDVEFLDRGYEEEECESSDEEEDERACDAEEYAAGYEEREPFLRSEECVYREQ